MEEAEKSHQTYLTQQNQVRDFPSGSFLSDDDLEQGGLVDIYGFLFEVHEKQESKPNQNRFLIYFEFIRIIFNLASLLLLKLKSHNKI